MKCGHCKTEDVTVAHVRQCNGTPEGVVLVRPKRAPAARGMEFFGGDVAPIGRPATERQVKFIADLRKERNMDELPFAGTSKQASEEIERLKGIARPAKVRSEPVDDGVYRSKAENGVEAIYKVLTAHYGSAEGYSYAKRLILVEREADELDPNHPEWTHKGSWVKAPGMQYRLRPDELLPHDEAVGYGKLYGFCVICGRILENEQSKERGMGPTCAGKF